MKAAAVGAALLVAGLVLAWAWPRALPPASPTLPAADAAPTPGVAEATAAADQAARSEVSPARGAFRGRVVTAARAPIAGAEVGIVDGGMPNATSAADGTFLIAGAGDARQSLRFSAPGFATAQLADQTVRGVEIVELGEIVLREIATYRGRVYSQGRGLAGAEIAFRPVLDPGFDAVPLVQRVTSGADGWFYCDAAPSPPVLVTPRAPDHRQVAALRLESAAAELRFDLEPLPVVRGRVLDAATGLPLAAAHVLALDWNREWTLPAMPPHFVPTPRSAVAADGRFERRVGAADCLLLAAADGYRAVALGPFAGRDAAEHTVVLQRGAVVVCTATWRGERVRALAELFADDGTTHPPTASAQVEIAAPARLPAVAWGRWLLRVQADGAAWHEQWLDLREAGEHVVDVVLQDGARLVGRCRDGVVGGRQVECRHASGRVLRGPVFGDGTFAVAGLHAGRWAAAILDPFADAVAQRATQLSLELGEAVVDVRPGDGDVQLELDAPLRHFGSVAIAARGVAVGTRFELRRDGDPEPRAFDVATLAADGTATIAPVPPGTWQLVMLAAGAPVLPRTVVVQAGVVTDVEVSPR